MSLINFSDIDFNKSINKPNKVITFNGSEIEVINYLSSSDKYDLITSTIQKAFPKNGIFDDFRTKVFFNLNIVYLYTNIVFSAKERANEFELYDTLSQSGLLELIKAEIDEKELEELYNTIIITQERIIAYNNTTASIIYDFIETIPEKFKQFRDFMNSFDKEKIQSIKDLAQSFAVGMKNDING